MTETRSPDDLVAAVVDLQARLADLESTLMVRVARRPTGDIEPTIRATPKPNTLFMVGQVVLRADYPVLFQFATDNGLFTVGLFGPGDGVTNFGLPNFTGRTIIGAGGVNAVGAEVGTDTKTISIANLPAHDHNVNGHADYAGSHWHNINSGTGSGGGHDNHVPGGGYVLTNGAPPGGIANVAHDVRQSVGSHTHSINTSVGTQADHWHELVLGETSVGGGTALDVRQSSKAVNWMIYI